MSDKIYAPFSDAQVSALNRFQGIGIMHPFTCMGEHCIRVEREDQGILIATNEGWKCGCGKYTQDWAHGYMANIETIKTHLQGLKEQFGDLIKLPEGFE